MPNPHSVKPRQRLTYTEKHRIVAYFVSHGRDHGATLARFYRKSASNRKRTKTWSMAHLSNFLWARVAQELGVVVDNIEAEQESNDEREEVVV